MARASLINNPVNAVVRSYYSHAEECDNSLILEVSRRMRGAGNGGTRGYHL